MHFIMPSQETPFRQQFSGSTEKILSVHGAFGINYSNTERVAVNAAYREARQPTS